MRRRVVCLALFCVAAYTVQAQSEAAPSIGLTPEPGTYRNDRAVSATVADMEYRFVTPAGTPHTDFFIPFDNALLLRVPDDAEAYFSLEVRRRNRPESTRFATYTIDKLAPPAVRVEPTQGLYTTAINIVPPPDGGGAERVFYYIANGAADVSFAPVPEQGVSLDGAAGAVVDYRLALYAVDAAGNRGPLRSVHYRIDRRWERERSGPIIVSPISGTFANRQLLYLDTQGLVDVSVRLVGPDGRDERFSYREELLIEGAGRYTAYVSGRERATDSPVSEEVTWEQDTLAVPLAVSGRATQTVRVASPEGVRRYTLEDRAPTAADALFLRPLSLPIQVDTLRTVALRHANAEGLNESRYLFLLDGRRPPPPEFILDGEDIISFSLADTTVEWQPIGHTGAPFDEWRAWEDPVSRTDLPEGVTSLRARARFDGSRWSAVSTVSVTRLSRSPLPSPIAVAAGSVVEFALPSDSEPLKDPEPHETLRLRVMSGNTESDGEPMSADASIVFRAAPRSRLRWYLPEGYNDRLIPTLESDRRVDATRSGEAVVADAAPPSPPTIVIDDNRVVLGGEGERYYRINDGTVRPYRDAVVLAARDGVALQYRFEAYRTVAGRVSPTVVQTVTVDRRELFLPTLETGARRALYNDERVVLRFANPYDDLLIYYEISTAGNAPIPRDESPSTTRTIVLTTPAGEVREYAIAVRARFESSSRWSELRRFTVRVDRVPPEPPELERSALPEVASGPFLVAFEAPADPLTTIWFRIDPSREFRRYVSPVGLNPSLLELNEIVIEAYSEDRAGNRRYMDDPPRIVLNSTRPDPPGITVNGRPATGRRIDSARELLIAPATPPTVDMGADEPRIWWRIYSPEGGSSPSATDVEHDTPDFERFDGTDRLLEVASDGREVSYIVETFLEDSRGRRSALRRFDVVMDSRPPAPPEAPFVVRSPDGRSGTVTWPGTGNADLFVAVAGVDSPEYFVPVDGALPWGFSAGQDTITFNYFSVDGAGNRSELRTLTIAASDRLSAPRFVGVEDGGIYRDGRVLTMEGEAEIRYTLSVDGDDAPIVHPLSARYESPLVLDAAVGEEVTYHIRARTLDSAGALHGERQVRFTVDRRSPPLPEIVGIEDSAYYPNPREARLLALDGDTIMYRIRSEDRDGGGTANGEAAFKEYRGEPLELSAPPGAFTRYTVEAYSVDPAGNRSQEIRRWSAVIDRSIVYVARDGRPGAEGTRDDPLDDLDEALEMAVARRRQTILLSGGRYAIAPHSLSRTVAQGGRTITLIGGAEEGTWTPEGGPTTIATTDGTPLVLAPGVSLHDLIVDATLHSDSDAGLRTGGEAPFGGREIRLLRTTIGTPGAERELRHTVGRIVVRESLIAGAGGLVVAPGAAATIEDSDIDRVDIAGGVVSVSGGRLGAVAASDGASITLSDMNLDGHGADPLSGSIHVDGSELAVERSVISAGVAEGLSVLHAVAVRSTDSRITIDRSALLVRGRESALGMRLRGGTLSMRDSLIASDSEGAGYGIVAREDAEIALTGSVVAVRSTADALALVGSGSRFVADRSIFRVDDTGVVSGKVADLAGRAGSLVLRDVLFSRSGEPVTDTPSLSIGPDSELSVARAAIDGWVAVVETSSTDSWRETNRFSLPRLNASTMGEDNRIVRYDGSPIYHLPDRDDIPTVLRRFGGSWWDR